MHWGAVNALSLIPNWKTFSALMMMMSQHESNIGDGRDGGGGGELLGSATPSMLLQYKLRRSHFRRT